VTTAEGIITAAGAIMERRENELPGVADIAREAGVTRPTVYAYFDNSLAVFAALAARLRDRVLAIQEQADTSSHAATFSSTLVARLDLQVKHCGLLAVLAEQARLQPKMRELWHDIYDHPLRRHARFIDRLASRGEAGPVAPGLVIAEAVDGISLRFAHLIAEDPSRRDELASRLVDIHARLLGL
jgi:AcrR family transcriptional regulator